VPLARTQSGHATTLPAMLGAEARKEEVEMDTIEKTTGFG
jgi:hypothetical protein